MPNDAGANKALEMAISVVETMSEMTGILTENAVATAALISALSDEFPQLGARYEKYRATQTNSPLVQTSAVMRAELEQLAAELRKLKV